MPRRRSPSNATQPRPPVLALLRAAKEAPEDDTPRLVLADWLQEHGGPPDLARAEFVRVQCALARLPKGDSRRAALQRREQELREQHRAAWLGPLLDRAQAHWFSRGLVGTEVRPRQLFSSALAAWAGEEPAAWVEHLCVYHLTAHGLRRLAGGRLLPGLTGLALGFLKTADGLPALAASPHIARLRRLTLNGHLGEEGPAALVGSPYLSGLRELTLGASGIGAPGVRRLASWPGLARLTVLNLPGNSVGDAGAAALAASPHLAGLATLELTANAITQAGARALANSPYLAGLRRLDLGNNYLLDAGVEVLAASPYLANLTHLGLWFTAVGSAGAAALAASPYLGNLVKLDLTANGSLPGTEGAQALRQRFGDRVRLTAGEG